MITEPEETGLLTAPETQPSTTDPLQAMFAIEQPRDDAAGGQPAAASVAAGDNYGEFEWPEGYQADPEALGRFVPLAKKLGLPKQAAQELAHLYVELDRQNNATTAALIAETNGKWLNEVREHPEFGGDNLQRTGESVASLMRRYGSPLLMAQVRQMNVQNWPEMFYFLARVSQSMAEDCSPPSGGDRLAAQSTARLLFPDLK